MISIPTLYTTPLHKLLNGPSKVKNLPHLPLRYFVSPYLNASPVDGVVLYTSTATGFLDNGLGFRFGFGFGFEFRLGFGAPPLLTVIETVVGSKMNEWM